MSICQFTERTIIASIVKTKKQTTKKRTKCITGSKVFLNKQRAYSIYVVMGWFNARQDGYLREHIPFPTTNTLEVK